MRRLEFDKKQQKAEQVFPSPPPNLPFPSPYNFTFLKLHSEHLQDIRRKAENESKKVEEVAFITELR